MLAGSETDIRFGIEARRSEERRDPNKRKGKELKKINGKEETEGARIDKELNLKGKVCPYTFIESMLTLEEMAAGEVLRVVVDYPAAVCDVPRSLKNEGYEILEVSPINGTDWAIIVRNTGVDEI